jgi:hypothetical protein
MMRTIERRCDLEGCDWQPLILPQSGNTILEVTNFVILST